MERESPNENQPRHRFLKKLVIWVGVPLLALLVALAAIILPSQVRPVTTPVLSRELALFPAPEPANAGAVSPYGGAGAASPTLAVDVAHTDRATSWTTETLRAAAKRIVDEASQQARINYDFSHVSPKLQEALNAAVKRQNDPANWTNEQRATVEHFHAELAKYIVECMSLPHTTRNLPYIEAHKLYRTKLGETERALFDQYLLHLPGSQGSLFNILNEYRNKASLAIALDHQDWTGAGMDAWRLKGYDQATYYFRQAGVSGRVILAGLTVGTFVDKKIITPFQQWRRK